MIWTVDELGWPWLCLGGALVMFAVMFGTNALRAQPLTGSRWRDPVWLAWLVVPVLMLHMFEEYGHDVLGRPYQFAAGFCHTMGFAQYPDCPIPRVHYPLVNLGVAWLGAPLAALLARRNLIIGLSWYGLLLFNGLVHIGSAIALGKDSLMGVVSGSLFIPLVIWVCYAIRKTRALPGAALTVSIFAGVIAHTALMASLQLLKHTLIGPTGLLIADGVTIALPFLVGGVASSFFESSALSGTQPLRTLK